MNENQIKPKSQNTRKIRLTFIEWLILISIILILLGLLLPHRHRIKKYYIAGRCQFNLQQLGKALLTYSCGDKPYPVDNWCDTLIDFSEKDKSVDLAVEYFKCPADNNGPCSYAINPNANPRSSPDTVLLFETKPGWNQAGGPEILTSEYHSDNRCAVLFNDGHVDFVEPRQTKNLKWKTE